MAEQLARFAPWAEALRALSPGVLVHAANSAATLREPEPRASTSSAAASPSTAWTRSRRDPAAHGPRARARRSSPTSPRSSRIAPGQSAGYGRRFVAEAPTWLGTLPIGYADGVRRALTNNADVLVGGRRVPLVGTVSMDNITVDLGAGGAGRAAAAEAVLIGAPGRRADPRRGGRAAARHDQLRGDLRDLGARAARTTSELVSRPARGIAREALAGEAGLARRRRGARPAARAARPTTSTSRWPATPRPAARAPGPRGRRHAVPRSPTRSAPGAWSAREPRLARRPRARCATATSPPTSPRATSPSTRWPSRSPAASWSTRTAAAPTSRRGGCGWSRRGASPRTRCARCARPASRTSSSSRSTTETAAAAREPRRRELERVARRARVRRAEAGSSPATAPVDRPRADGRRSALAAVVLPELVRAARRRAERLPPPRRLRPHARGARRGRRAARGPGAPALGEHAGAVARCWPSRSPTS